MLVKHNLYINPVLQKPNMGGFELIDGKLVSNNFDAGAYGFLQENYNLKIGQKYYVGFVGKVDGRLRLYKETYLDITSRGKFHYIEHIYSANTKPLHMWGYDTDLVIEKIFITDEIPDIVIPNKKDFSEDIQAYYPPEGNYKEIQAL